MPDRYGDDPEDNVVAFPDRARGRDSAMAIVNCGLCDDEGYRNFAVCDHVDRQHVARRGVERCRAVLAEIKARKAKQ